MGHVIRNTTGWAHVPEIPSRRMIAVGGENLIDMIQSRDSADGRVFTAATGGSCYNCALALGRMGAETAYVTPISTDGFGDRLAAGLEDSGVVLAAARVPNPTSVAIVTLADGHPSYRFYRENTAERCVGAEETDRLTVGASIFHVGSFALLDGDDAGIWVDLLARNRSRGVITSVDVNVRPTLIGDRGAYLDRLGAVLQSVDILKLSDEDLAWIAPDVPTDEAFDQIRARSVASLAVLTRGGAGATLASQVAVVRVPAHPVRVFADTVGAGDTFMAALLASVDHLGAGQLAEYDPETLTAIGSLAAEAASLNCEREGCDPPLRAELTTAEAVFG